jgi:hypothetical protein
MVDGQFAEIHFTERHFAERHFAERTFCRRAFCRTDVLPNGHFAERTFNRTDSLLSGQFAENREISSEIYRFAYTVKVSVIKVIFDFDDRNFDSEI